LKLFAWMFEVVWLYIRGCEMIDKLSGSVDKGTVSDGPSNLGTWS
jgi:hypothetical protein